jgi:multidrug efflux pump subunit AcrB
MSPLVAEVYGPDEAGRQKVAARIAKAFSATPDIVGTDTTLREDAPRAFLRVQRQRAESLGIPVASVAQTVQGALSGMDAAYLHDGQSKHPVPVRLQLPRERQVGLDALLQLPMRAGQRPTGAAVRAGAHRKGRDRQAALHQGPASGELRVRRHGRQARLAAVRAVRNP